MSLLRRPALAVVGRNSEEELLTAEGSAKVKGAAHKPERTLDSIAHAEGPIIAL